MWKLSQREILISMMLMTESVEHTILQDEHDLVANFRKSIAVKPVICEYCGKKFSYPFLLKRHIVSHTGERLFSCSICSKSFKHVENLKSHLTCHDTNRVRRFPCELCSYKSFTNSQLKQHVLKKHNERKEEDMPRCDHCGKLFSSKGSLQKHKTTKNVCPRNRHNAHIQGLSSTEAIKKSEICPKEMYHYYNKVTRHVAYGQDLSYNCSHCEKPFLSNEYLQQHIHNDHQSAFRCLFCKMEFAHKTVFDNHQMLCNSTNAIFTTDPTEMTV